MFYNLGRVVSYLESQQRYRIDHYQSIGELPYFALTFHPGQTRRDLLSRHATMNEAIAACEQHLRAQGGAAANVRRTNEAGDPLPRRFGGGNHPTP
jgi:hypothetical protein